MEKKKLAKISLAILLCFVCLPVQAELITIRLTGNVYMVDDSQHVLGGQIHYNDTITGTYTYDTSTPDSEPSASGGSYSHYSAPCGVSFTINGFNFRTDPNNVFFRVGIGNNISSLGDIYDFCSYNNLPLSNGALVSTIDWQITDSSMSALSSDALPTTAPNLANFDMDYGLNIVGGAGDNYFHLATDITSATVIPEPATLLLMVSGLLLLRKTKASR